MAKERNVNKKMLKSFWLSGQISIFSASSSFPILVCASFYCVPCIAFFFVPCLVLKYTMNIFISLSRRWHIPYFVQIHEYTRAHLATLDFGRACLPLEIHLSTFFSSKEHSIQVRISITAGAFLRVATSPSVKLLWTHVRRKIVVRRLIVNRQHINHALPQLINFFIFFNVPRLCKLQRKNNGERTIKVGESKLAPHEMGLFSSVSKCRMSFDLIVISSVLFYSACVNCLCIWTNCQASLYWHN